MVGIVGIVVSLGSLIFLAYRGWNVIMIAPVCAGVALLFSWGEAPLLATYTQTFMPALGTYLAKFFPLFMLGAIFGKLMDDSGCARAIAHQIVQWTGKKRAILAIVLACAILTYGGVSLFVVAFSVYPIAISMFREADVPKRFIPAAIGLGSFTFTMTALPGTPSIQNAIPMPFFGTTPFAAPGLGIIAGLFMFGFGMLWLNRRSASAMAGGEGYGAHLEEPVPVIEGVLPNFWVALLPIVLVISLNFVFTTYVIPAMDTSYLATPKFKNTPLSAVAGLWSIILAMVIACIVVAVLNRHRFARLLDTLNKGTVGSFLPIMNVASEVAYGAVIASLAAFITVREALKSLFSDPVISLFVVVNVLAGMTGSASGGLSLALGALGEYYAHTAQVAGISPQIMHRVATLASGGMDILPHNGAVITLLSICALTHRESYFDLFVVGSIGTTLAGILVIVLNAVFGTF
jgi:H+/gluconate symporter-like permease